MQSEYATSMFPDDISNSRHSVLFLAACSLGVPLSLCPNGNDRSWKDLAETLKARLSRHALFEVVPIDHHPETLFPLGTPITVRSTHLFEVFDLDRFQNDANLLPSDHTLDHVIWICPSGIVLIIGKVSSHDRRPIDLRRLNQLEFESHYPELGFVFNEIAEVVLGALPAEFLKPPMCCERDISRINTGISLRNKHGLNASDGLAIENWLSSNPAAAQLYEDQVLDVYYIDYQADGAQHTQVEYFSAMVKSCDPYYVLMTAITYSSFVCLVWLVRHLGEQVSILQSELTSQSGFNTDITPQLKLLRIFCLRFINESNPIQIRLKTEYMQCLEAGWKPYRLDKLITQVNEQLTTLESIVDWIDDRARTTRESKNKYCSSGTIDHLYYCSCCAACIDARCAFPTWSNGKIVVCVVRVVSRRGAYWPRHFPLS